MWITLEMTLVAFFLQLLKNVAAFAIILLVAKHILGVTTVAVHAGSKVVKGLQYLSLECALPFWSFLLALLLRKMWITVGN
jgi:hypothetical protein